MKPSFRHLRSATGAGSVAGDADTLQTRAGSTMRNTPDARQFVEVLAPALREAASIARALQGRVRNRPKPGEATPIKAALTAADTACQEVLLAALPLSAQQRGLQPTDSYKMQSVGGVALSPTAAHVAFTVTTTNEAANNRATAIWLQELRNGAPVGEPVRYTDPTRTSNNPVWSPDGTVLSFSSRRSAGGTATSSGEESDQWFIRVGGIAAPRPVTRN